MFTPKVLSQEQDPRLTSKKTMYALNQVLLSDVDFFVSNIDTGVDNDQFQSEGFSNSKHQKSVMCYESLDSSQDWDKKGGDKENIKRTFTPIENSPKLGANFNRYSDRYDNYDDLENETNYVLDNR